MNKENQIEQMAKDLCKNALTEYCASGRCSNMNCLVNAKAIETLTTKGYRKASEVAEEIFAEIEKIVAKEIHRCDSMRDGEKNASERIYWEGGRHSLQKVRYWVAELKKKYQEGER